MLHRISGLEGAPFAAFLHCCKCLFAKKFESLPLMKISALGNVKPALALKHLTVAFWVALGTPAISQDTLDGLQIGTGSELSIVMLHGDEGNGGDPLSYFTLGADIARRIPEATVHMLILKWSCFLGQVCGLSKMHQIYVHAAFRISACSKYAASGVRLSSA
ncbi:hypothetical protein, partial [Roseinatronobacter ekhonensis]|uniref:hypothetical protein n=1 Tax=Roseinatronobacter ekhonensis TaxID=254356 RepID=UPI0011C3C613